ncbi:MAG: hypothetical protein IPN36_17010 [Bacteroidetes bacterium]|nr:hypothetical protein [Bacteroidota bacterium]
MHVLSNTADRGLNKSLCNRYSAVEGHPGSRLPNRNRTFSPLTHTIQPDHCTSTGYATRGQMVVSLPAEMLEVVSQQKITQSIADGTTAAQTIRIGKANRI